MNVTTEILGFSEWQIPSGEGVIYMEGIPTKEVRDANRRSTAARRKKWQPSEKAIEIFKQLVLLEGRKVKIQLWEELMLWDEEEGTNPFVCMLVNVFVTTEKKEDRDFLQLYIQFKDYEVIDMGNIGGNPINKFTFDPKTEIYTHNCASLYSVSSEYIK